MCPFCKDKPCNEEHCPYTKEKKAFENWLKDNFSKLIDQGNKGGLSKMNEDLTQCWLAACEYKQKEYSNLIDAMTQTSQNNARLSIIIENQKTVIEINQAENAKLRECVEFYCNANTIMQSADGIFIRQGWDGNFFELREYARQVLKELE